MLAMFNRRRKTTPKPCGHQMSATQSQVIRIPPEPSEAAPALVEPPEEIQEAPKEQTNDEGGRDQISEKPIGLTETGETTSPCLVCKEEKRVARRYRWVLIAGLFLPFSLQAMDATIVASALPFIASDFHELAQLNWIVSAFNLTAATSIPAWGQFADIFGRHVSLQASLLLMLVGSALCSGAPVNAFPMLLLGRAFQGISCSGIGILTRVILADKVSLKENAKNNTIFALVGGLGYAVGPVIGGYLTQVSWRYCFIINLPIAGIGMVSTFFLLRPALLGPQTTPTEHGSQGQSLPTLKTQLLTIDYGGQLLFLFGMGLLVLALTWGGSYYPWSDVKVLAPLVIGFVLFSAFLIWEYLMMPGKKLAVKYPQQVAMIPIKLIWTRNAGLLMYINFVTGMALFSVFYFVDLYFALVLAYPPGRAGVQLLFYTPGLGVGSYLAMFACNIYPRQTWVPLTFGTIIEPLGITLLAVALSWDNLPLIYGMLGLAGAGTGIRFMPGTLHGVGYFPKKIATITSLMSLALSLGGTFAMTIMFTVFNNSLQQAGINFSAGTQSSFDQIGKLPSDTVAYLRDQSRRAIVVSFFALCAFLWLGVVAMAFMGNVHIQENAKVVEEGPRDFSEHVVIKGSYLGSLLSKRRVNSEREKGAVQQTH